MSENLSVIAIDGPAASGKSTTAKEVAKHLGWRYIDTGAMYRTLGLAVLRAGKSPENEEDVRPVAQNVSIDLEPGVPTTVKLNGEDVTELIRTPEVSEAASQVSVHPFVRKRMVELQRELGIAGPSVLEGRDIGSVIFPDAGLKVYLNASVEERVRRRVADYHAKGMEIDHREVREELERRDERDSTRADSPLVIAEDAVPLDTTGMSIPGQVEAVLELARVRFGI